jgi:hypothetical protein
MGWALLGYLCFSLWWTSCAPSPFPVPVWRELYCFREKGTPVYIEILRPLTPAPEWDFLTRVAYPGGPVLGEKRTRFVQQLFFADIDRNGASELIALVAKPISGRLYKRIYVYRLERHALVQQWLGSRLVHTLVSAAVVPHRGGWILQTAEASAHQLWEGRYTWDSWGFRTLTMKEKKEP